MPVELGDKGAVLSGVVTVEEVEALAGWLRTTIRPKVNMRNCTHLHTGAFQALLRFQPKIGSAPLDSFLAGQVMPLLTPRSES